MNTIVLDLTKHKGKAVILLKFPYNSQLIALTRQLPEALWSSTLKAWYIPYTNDSVRAITTLFSGAALVDDLSVIKQLENAKKAPPDIKNYILSTEAQVAIGKFENFLGSRRYSSNTISTYTDALKTFLKFYSDKAIADITNEDVISFNIKYILANNYSASYQSQVVNSTRYIYLNEPFVFLGRYNGVLAYPTHLSLLCTFCSSVPAFAVSLPSVHTSR
ncbi:MAG: phage integrase N-terminal SAM-like domain-containing protein [Bacteroidota bacterium]